MESKDLLTVILTCHDSKDHLKTSIPSVLNQSYSDFELLLVDDHSTDEYSLDLMHDFVRQDPRIKLICNPSNLEVSYSRNKGVELAKGKYFTFLDHDDSFAPDFLAKMYEALELTQSKLAWCHIHSYKKADTDVTCVPEGSYIPHNFFNLAQQVSEDVYLLEREALLNDPQFLFVPILPMGKLINLEIYKQANLSFKDCYAAEDQDWCLRLFCEFPSYALIASPCAERLIASRSLSHTTGERVYNGLLMAMQERYKALVKYGLFERFSRCICFTLLAFINQLKLVLSHSNESNTSKKFFLY